MNPDIMDAESVRHLFDYDQTTGVFRWRNPRNLGHAKAGAVIRSLEWKGYLRVSSGGKSHKLHRLAWLYVYGRWPTGALDHINGDRQDNRIVNLREASPSQNSFSRASQRFRGASFHKSTGKWQAQISRDNQYIYIGLYENREAARAAYLAKAKELFGEQFCGRL